MGDPIEPEPGDIPVPEPGRRPFRARLPGFLIPEPTGLGDLVKRATHSIGIRPCAACEQRAAALNQWMQFTR